MLFFTPEEHASVTIRQHATCWQLIVHPTLGSTQVLTRLVCDQLIAAALLSSMTHQSRWGHTASCNRRSHLPITLAASHLRTLPAVDQNMPQGSCHEMACSAAALMAQDKCWSPGRQPPCLIIPVAFAPMQERSVTSAGRIDRSKPVKPAHKADQKTALLNCGAEDTESFMFKDNALFIMLFLSCQSLWTFFCDFTYTAETEFGQSSRILLLMCLSGVATQQTQRPGADGKDSGPQVMCIVDTQHRRASDHVPTCLEGAGQGCKPTASLQPTVHCAAAACGRHQPQS